MITDEETVPCAHCESVYTHHDEVSVFSRKHEDSDNGATFTINSQRASRSTCYKRMGDNPSSRRDGLTIEYWCETCGMYSRICIAQHKGQTFLTLEPMTRQHHKEGEQW